MDNLINPRLQENEYHTPAGRRRAMKYRFLPCRTLLFNWEILTQVVLPARRAGMRGEYLPPQLVRSSMRVMDAVEKTGVKIHISGLDVLRNLQGPVVFAGNHMSTLETFLMPGIIVPFRPLCFIVKSALNQGFFGPVLSRLEAIGVERSDPRADLKAVLEQGQEKLGRGISVFVYPQSTRSLVFNEKKFNSLAEKLARRSNVPLVPVACRTDFYSPGRVIREMGRLRPERDLFFAFGQPLPTDLPAKERQQQLVHFLKTHLHEWGVQCVSGEESDE